MYLQLTRFTDDGIQSRGILELFDSQGNKLFHCQTLELSYKENQRKISCIKSGVYQVIPNFSFKHGKGFRLLNVPNRDGILIHKGNFNTQTQGCILVGNGWADINDDRVVDILNSGVTMASLLAILKNPTIIFILDETR